MYKSILITFILFSLICVVPAEARYIGYADDPLEIGIGARSMAMGGTFVAARDCVNSVFNNPATMSGNPSFTFSTMLGKLLGDVSYNVISYTTPLSLGKIKGTLGLGYLSSDTGPIISPTQSGFTQFSYASTIKIFSYSEQNLGPWKSFSIGGRLKLFDQGFSGSVNYAGSGMDLDLGILHTPDPKTSVGLLLKNVLPMSLGGKIAFPNGDEESLPASYRIGITSRHLNPNLLLALDYDSYVHRDYPATWHFGAEYRLQSFLVLRGGFDQTASAGSVTTSPTYGLNLFLDPSFRISYAYHAYSDNSNNFNQYLSIVYEPYTKKEIPVTPIISPEAQPTALPPSELRPDRYSLRITRPIPIVATPEVIKNNKAEKLPARPLYFTTLNSLTPGKTYRVKAGDTLASIVTNYYQLNDPAEIDRATQTVALFNNIKPSDKLALSKIKLPKVMPLKNGENFPSWEKIIGFETYTVQPGENLNQIVSRYYELSDLTQIYQARDVTAHFNQIDPDQIQTGQTLRLLKKTKMTKLLEELSVPPKEMVSPEVTKINKVEIGTSESINIKFKNLPARPIYSTTLNNLTPSKTYRVKAGETLPSIVSKYYQLTDPAEIERATQTIALFNNINPSNKLVLERIKLPKVKVLGNGEIFPSWEKIIGFETYTVQPGENLNQIISRYYELSDLTQIYQARDVTAHFNQIDPDQIQTGQTLRLLKKPKMMKLLEETSTLPEETVSFSVPLNPSKYNLYPVRPGETLSKIVAKAYQLTGPKEIATLTEIVANINHLQNSEVFQRDQIKLPKLGKIRVAIKPMVLDELFETNTYTVGNDDLYYGIYVIAARYYVLKDPIAIVRVTQFVARANAVDPLRLHEGQKLILPKTETIQKLILSI